MPAQRKRSGLWDSSPDSLRKFIPLMVAFTLGFAGALVLHLMLEWAQGDYPGLLLGGFLGFLGIACGCLGLLAANVGSGEKSIESGETTSSPPLPHAPTYESSPAAVDHEPDRQGDSESAGAGWPYAQTQGGVDSAPASSRGPGSAHPSVPISEPPEDTPRDVAPNVYVPSSPSSMPNLDPGILTEVWRDYLERGDGRFDRRGLRRHLERAGVEARVMGADELGTHDPVLGVSPSEGSHIYLLPDFNRPARAVAEWFADQGSGERTARITRLLDVAIVEKGDSVPHLVRKGTVA